MTHSATTIWLDPELLNFVPKPSSGEIVPVAIRFRTSNYRPVDKVAFVGDFVNARVVPSIAVRISDSFGDFVRQKIRDAIRSTI